MPLPCPPVQLSRIMPGQAGLGKPALHALPEGPRVPLRVPLLRVPEGAPCPVPRAPGRPARAPCGRGCPSVPEGAPPCPSVPLSRARARAVCRARAAVPCAPCACPVRPCPAPAPCAPALPWHALPCPALTSRHAQARGDISSQQTMLTCENEFQQTVLREPICICKHPASGCFRLCRTNGPCLAR